MPDSSAHDRVEGVVPGNTAGAAGAAVVWAHNAPWNVSKHATKPTSRLRDAGNALGRVGGTPEAAKVGMQMAGMAKKGQLFWFMRRYCANPGSV